MLYTRRHLLASIGCASGAAVALRSGSLLAAACAAGDAIASLRCLVDDAASARQLGRIYRRQFPSEADPAMLARVILATLAPGNMHGRSLRREVLLPALEQCVRAEFGAGSTVQLDGWFLARTEARLCALCE
jgi:alkylhydroperoxidase family enzyme